jgi:ribosomal biogenesis protein LAS1
MSWLLYNYFLPTLSPSSSSSQVAASAASGVRPLPPVLKVYKNTMKTITRDVSLAKEHKPRLVALMRDLERWIAENKVAANAVNIVSGDADSDIDWTTDASVSGDAKEIWALEQFVNVLAERGMLVPVSKK